MSKQSSPSQTAFGGDSLDRSPVRAAMADGRELIYFFDTPDRSAEFVAPADTRDLPPRPPVSELRYDALSGEWVSFAAHRQTRTHLPAASECPLCPTRSEMASEIPAESYDVAVFENRFPSFGPEQHTSDVAAELGAFTPSHGRCEVVAFGPGHTDSLASLGVDRIRTVIDAWAHRSTELGNARGRRTGLRLRKPRRRNRRDPAPPARADLRLPVHHPANRQPAGPGRVPPGTNRAATSWPTSWRSSSPTASASSSAAPTGLPLSRTPPACPSRSTWCPNRQVAELGELTAEERDELAEMYHRLLCSVDALYSTPTPYIAGWFQAPRTHPNRDEAWLHLQLTSPRRAEDKMKYLAGSEAAMGAFIGDVTPETSAKSLRDAASRANGDA